MDIQDLIGTKEAAEYADRSQAQLQLLLRTGKINGWLKSGRWFTTKAEVDKYLATDPKPGRKGQNG